MDRAQLPLLALRDRDVGAARAENRRLQVVGAADQGAALDEVGRQTALAPARGRQQRREMRAGRMAADIKPVGVDAEAWGIPMDPCHGTTKLVDDVRQAHLRQFREVEDDDAEPLGHERPRHEGEVVLSEVPPSSPVNEDQRRGVALRSREDVELLVVGLAIADRAMRGRASKRLALAGVAGEIRRRIRAPRPLVIVPIELGLGVVKEDLCSHVGDGGYSPPPAVASVPAR